MGLAGTGLAVREASSHAALEHALDERGGREVVHELVVRAVVERVVEAELLVLQVLRQVHLQLRLVHHHVLPIRHSHHVDLLSRDFWIETENAIKTCNL